MFYLIYFLIIICFILLRTFKYPVLNGFNNMANELQMPNPSLEGLDKYKCSICLEYLNKPMLTRCGHRYCESCLSTWLTSHISCPICKKNVNKDSDIFPDNFTKRELMEIRAHVECPNAGHGCSVKMLSSDLAEHNKTCLFASSTNNDGKIVCSFINIGCTKVFSTFAERQTHLAHSVRDHLNLLIVAYNDTTTDNYQDRKRIQKQIVELNELRDQLKEMDKLSLSILFYKGSLIWAIDNFIEICKNDFEFTSPAFYSSFREYKYCINVSFCKAISSYVKIKVLSKHSENDSHLKWPCVINSCTIFILKHLDDSNDAINHSKDKISVLRPTQQNSTIVWELANYYPGDLSKCAIENRLWLKVSIDLVKSD